MRLGSAKPCCNDDVLKMMDDFSLFQGLPRLSVYNMNKSMVSRETFDTAIVY